MHQVTAEGNAYWQVVVRTTWDDTEVSWVASTAWYYWECRQTPVTHAQANDGNEYRAASCWMVLKACLCFKPKTPAVHSPDHAEPRPLLTEQVEQRPVQATRNAEVGVVGICWFCHSCLCAAYDMLHIRPLPERTFLKREILSWYLSPS